MRLNGQDLRGTYKEFVVNSEEKALSRPPTEKVKNWRLYVSAKDIPPMQRKYVKEAHVATIHNLDNEKFSLHFEDFSRSRLEEVEIRVNVFDDRKVLKAYYDASLKNLHIASKKGKNIWLCLNTNEDTDAKFPLLHLKIETRMIRTKEERLQLASRAGGFARQTETGYIEDTFYNYRFKVPTITPDHKEFLSLLPPSWNIIDQSTPDPTKPGSQADFVQKTRYKLIKHYHETTSRQIARLKKSAYIWAQLQDAIASNYFPGLGSEDKNQLYIGEGYMRMVTPNTDREYKETPRGAGNLVSYLFKRDLWESKVEWRKFYVELERLCKKGLPPHNRLEIWSEMSRVIYFIKLTKGYCGISLEDDVATESKVVYEDIKKKAQKEYSYLYQELEDDIKVLRESVGVRKLPYEKNIRSICRVFIYWSKVSNAWKKEEKRYFITYSRTIATLCYGFLVSQTCTFIEGNEKPDEHQVFWLLLALTTYILSSYFETNEHSVSVDRLTFGNHKELSRRRNTLVNSALRCNHMRGVKSDLLLLKFLLKDYQTEIYDKFEELGLPLEYYFADYMLSLFFTLFNPGLAFRIWDILFFEGSSANQVILHTNRM